MKNHMNAGRRCAYLERKIKETEEEIGRQEKAKQGVESLRKVYQEQPDFTDDKGAEDVTRQLLEVGGASVRRVHVHTHTHTPSLLPSPSLPPSLSLSLSLSLSPSLSPSLPLSLSLFPLRPMLC